MSVIKSLLNIEAFFKEMYSCPEHKGLYERLDKLLDEADEYIPKKDKAYFSDRVRDKVSDLNVQLSRDAFEKGFSTAVLLITESLKNQITK